MMTPADVHLNDLFTCCDSEHMTDHIYTETIIKSTQNEVTDTSKFGSSVIFLPAVREFMNLLYFTLYKHFISENTLNYFCIHIVCSNQNNSFLSTLFVGLYHFALKIFIRLSIYRAESTAALIFQFWWYCRWSDERKVSNIRTLRWGGTCFTHIWNLSQATAPLSL